MAKKISLVPQQLNLEMYAGDGAIFRLVVTDTAGQVIPITGTVLSQIRHKRADADASADFAVDLANGTDGVIVLSMTGAQTSGLMDSSDVFDGKWDVQWHPDGAEPITFFQGDVKCFLDVTRNGSGP